MRPAYGLLLAVNMLAKSEADRFTMLEAGYKRCTFVVNFRIVNCAKAKR